MGPETRFERLLVADIKRLLPGCIVLKLDTRQGIPDRLILWNDKWATLEVKAAENSIRQPNQPYYVHLMNEMSFSAFIHPGNRDEVLNALQQAFGA